MRFSDRLLTAAVPQTAIPYSNAWEIGVLYGPHGAPDFFTVEDIAMFFTTDWKVHYNSDRTGVRLTGGPVSARLADVLAGPPAGVDTVRE